jgi:hypothetical protein
MPRMEVDDYCNQQESIEGYSSSITNCLRCGKKLTNQEEYHCDKCYDIIMKEELEVMKQIRDEEWDELYNENWRFKDSRGRSVFRREL